MEPPEVDGQMDEVARNPAVAARALARLLEQEADSLDSLEVATFAPAVTRVRTAARQLTESLMERGWGADVTNELGHPDGIPEDLEREGEQCLCEEDAEELEDEDEETPTPAGRKFTYQTRFDFVVFDERALEQRLMERHHELGIDSPLEDTSAFPDEPLNLLLELDNPVHRNYIAAGVYMAYGEEFFAEVDRTLDEFDYDTQDDAYPAST